VLKSGIINSIWSNQFDYRFVSHSNSRKGKLVLIG